MRVYLLAIQTTLSSSAIAHMRWIGSSGLPPTAHNAQEISIARASVRVTRRMMLRAILLGVVVEGLKQRMTAAELRRDGIQERTYANTTHIQSHTGTRSAPKPF
jgi:hypothetical protein